MFRAFRTARRKSSFLALAIALAGGAAFASAAYVPAAMAQEVPSPSRGFSEVYSDIVPLVQGEGQDYVAATAMIPALVAAIENNRDRDLAGSILINVGSANTDRPMQRRGIEMRLQGGMVAPDQIGLLNWYAGNFAIEVGDFADARTYLGAALAAGYVAEGVDIVNLIAQTYLEEGNDRGSFDYLNGVIAQADAVGTPVREAWLRNSLQFAYEENMVPEASAIVLRLVEAYPSDRSWNDGLRVMSQLLELETDARVDLYRLMALHNSLIDRPNITDYIEAIDPRLMSNEVLGVLAIGVQNGVFTPSDPYYMEVAAIAEARAPVDRNGIATIVAEARRGDALDAMNAGDVLHSLDNYAQAEEMYVLGLERGFNPDTANMRIGINQALQGKSAEAVASFARVTGDRAAVAALWTVHVEGM